MENGRKLPHQLFSLVGSPLPPPPPQQLRPLLILDTIYGGITIGGGGVSIGSRRSRGCNSSACFIILRKKKRLSQNKNNTFLITSLIRNRFDASILIFSLADVSNHFTKPFSLQKSSICRALLTKPSLGKSHCNQI